MNSIKAGLLRAVGLLLLAVSIAAAAFYAPERSLQSLIANWAPAPSDFIELQLPGGRQLIHLRDQGPREDPLPLVLMHGTSASLHTWEGWVAGLAQTRRVITFDLPGFGLTGPSVDGNYSDEAYIRTVLALLDHLGLKQAVLGGNSLGGQIAWETALLHPKRVAGLVLVDSGGLATTPQPMPAAYRFVRLPGLRQVVSNLLPRQMVEGSLRQVYADPKQITPALVDRYFELALREGNRVALAHRMDQLRTGFYADRLPELKAPTLILWGGRDRLIPPDNAAFFAKQIAGSRLVMFEALGHAPQEENPAATLKPVQEFLASLPR